MNRVILYLAPVDWFWLKQRPHHFVEFLSENMRVVYVGKRSLRRNDELRRAHPELASVYRRAKFRVHSNLSVVRHRYLPLEHRYKFVKCVNNRLRLRNIRALMKTIKPDTIIITEPSMAAILDAPCFKGVRIIYDCMDDYKSFAWATPKFVIQDETRLVKRADHIIASSDALRLELEKFEGAKGRVTVINNGVETDHFDPSRFANGQEAGIYHKYDLSRGRKRVIYVGTISSWLDMPTVAFAAKANPNVDFIFVGAKEHGLDLRILNNIPNITFTGAQPYEDLPLILHGADVAMMPFKVNDLVRGVNPVKVYEYLAMGMPVLACAYPEMNLFGDLITTYDSNALFLTALTMLLNTRSSEQDMIRRRRFASLNSWQTRVDMLKRIIGLNGGP